MFSFFLSFIFKQFRFILEYSSKILELQEWLYPIKHITSYNYDGVSSAVLQLKQIADGIQKIPRPLITTCRILKHMTIQSDREYPNGKTNC
jgi:hypothetical protein